MLINLVYELGLLLMLRLLRVVVWVSCRMMCIWDAPWRRMAHPRLSGYMVSGYCTTQEWSVRCIFRCTFHAVLFPQFYTGGSQWYLLRQAKIFRTHIRMARSNFGRSFRKLA